MFSKVALFITAAFAVSALATPISGSCNSGPVQCCSTLYAPGSTEATNALVGLVGVVVDAITAQVGVECNPISIFGLGSGASCASTPVCCEDNDFDQRIGVNCSPFSL